MKQKTKRIKRALIATAAITIALGGAFGIYCGIYNHADDYALGNLKSDDFVDVIKDGKDYIFIPKIKSGKGFIFYGGGKVETKAYAPMMNSLAHLGIYCVLPHMSCNLAFFSSNAAKKYVNLNPNTQFFIGGHSLGGVFAADYAAKHEDDFKGLVMLASFSTSDISKKDFKTLSVTASNDKVLNWKNYEKNKSNLPNLAEYSIEGGIHSYFGSYGIQKGDGTPTITVKEQTTQVTTLIAASMYL